VGFALISLTVAHPFPGFAGEPAVDSHVRQAFTACRVIEDDRERVRCYDKLATMLSPPRFQGRLTAQTEPFEIQAPTMLRYESDGPIFVMYLKDAQGGIVQNLHIGGGGMATFLIEKPGTYSLQVSGSESWRIWLDPVS
jgi:hypothetical protein